MRFDGKSLLVTGGTSGIGLATATRLIAEGARVLVTGRSPEHLDAAQQALPTATVLANDVADPAAADALADAVRRFAPDGLDGAFLNAGYGSFAPLDAVDADAIDRHFAINVRAPILQAKALSAQLRDGAALLLIGSGTVPGGRADTIVYSASKAAIRQVARHLAIEFAPRRIRVNVVTPGATESGFHARGGMSEAAIADYRAAMADKIPLGRIGQPEDAAAVALFLLSDEAAFVSGSEYRVDGAMTLA